MADTPSDVSIGDIVALTLYLPIRNQAGAEAAAAALQTPGNAGYHHFISVSQFVSRYGATDNEIANLEAILVGLGFTINYVYPNHLAVEAVSTAATAQRVFGLTLKHVTLNGLAGIASTTPLQIPAALAGRIRGAAGFDTVTHARPNYLRAITQSQGPRVIPTALAGGTRGNYLPGDFAKYYNVDPIYRHGITGRGTTIGVVTLNDFKTSDAFTFWNALGLHVSPSRVTKINVDGGETATTNNLNGEGETDLDVEESGALAPDAKIRVYIAPNISNANFVNGFEAAASENIADTISSSWGQPELDYFYNLATKITGDSFLLDAFHDAFLEMALQGQTVFIASGDSGAFDTVRGCPLYGAPSAKSPTCNAPYAVDHPSSDPLVTAAGGTTTPFSFKRKKDGAKISVSHEQAWGWDYLSKEDPTIPVAAVFSVGGGGGVSSYWTLPWYQRGTPGMTRTKPGQFLTQNSGSGSALQYVLPSGFPGRNLPDISTDADPESGFQFIEEGQVYNFNGGTSFVAPQLNGVNALFVQALGGRVGQINPAIYRLGAEATNDIKLGDNWGYDALSGYDDAAGMGSLNATKLLVGLVSLEYGLSSPAAVRARKLLEP